MLGYPCVGYYNNKSVYIATIYIGVKVTGLWYLNCICVYYTIDGASRTGVR